MATEQLRELLGKIQAGFRRTLSKGALLADPDMLALHQRLLAINPKKLVEKPLEETRFVVVDTETTGLQAYAGDEICSISLLEMQGLELTGREFNTLIYPGRNIPEASTRIHHLSDDDVSDAPLIEEVMQEIGEFIGEGVLIGHHIGFDIRFLNKILRQELLCHLKHPWLDTMLLYLAHTGRVGHYTLEEVADYTQVVIEGRHTARGDAMITAKVFKQLVNVLMEYNNPVNKLIHRQYELGHF